MEADFFLLAALEEEAQAWFLVLLLPQTQEEEAVDQPFNY